MLHSYDKFKGLKACTYRRKSQESDERQILSLDTQRDICREILESYALEHVQDYHEKKSAKTPDQRMEFNRMMKTIQKGKIDVLVAWKIDRLARNMKEGGWLIDLLQQGYVKAIITKEKIYFPEDNTIITSIEMASATEYSRDLSNKVKEGLSRKARQGLPNGLAPIGYLNNTHKTQGERDWRNDPERLPLVKQVFNRLLTGKHSAHALYKWAKNDLKLTTAPHKRVGGNPISCASFYRMLRRTEYAGFQMYRGIRVNLSCITPIITEAEYWTLQRQLGQMGVPRPRTDISTYAGYIFAPDGKYCGPDKSFQVICDCKKKFSAKTRTECPECGTEIHTMNNPIYRHYTHYYNVSRKKKGLKCKSLNEKKVDELILSFAETITLPSDYIRWSQMYITLLYKQESNAMDERKKSQQQYLQKLKEKKERAKSAFLNGMFTEEEYQEIIEEVRIEELQNQSNISTDSWFDRAMELTTLGNDIQEAWKSGDVEAKRKVLDALGSNLQWNEENLSIYNKKQVDALAKSLTSIPSIYQGFEPENIVEIKGELSDFEKQFPELCGTWKKVRTILLKFDFLPRSERMVQFRNNLIGGN